MMYSSAYNMRRGIISNSDFSSHLFNKDVLFVAWGRIDVFIFLRSRDKIYRTKAPHILNTNNPYYMFLPIHASLHSSDSVSESRSFAFF